MTDSELLEDYARRGAEPALAALVARHLNLAYSVARRHVASSQPAEDVAQMVFVELARNARRSPLDIATINLIQRFESERRD